MKKSRRNGSGRRVTETIELADGVIDAHETAYVIMPINQQFARNLWVVEAKIFPTNTDPKSVWIEGESGGNFVLSRSRVKEVAFIDRRKAVMAMKLGRMT